MADYFKTETPVRFLCRASFLPFRIEAIGLGAGTLCAGLQSVRRPIFPKGVSRTISADFPPLAQAPPKVFFRLIYPCEWESLLDVGGTPGFWRSCPAAAPQITLLNPNAVAGWKSAGSKPFSYRLVRGDECRLPFADRSFTIGFSNSVLEHVGDAERQKAFAGEILRLPKKSGSSPRLLSARLNLTF